MKDIPAPVEEKGMYLLIPHTPHVIPESFVVGISFDAAAVSIDLARPGSGSIKGCFGPEPGNIAQTSL